MKWSLNYGVDSVNGSIGCIGLLKDGKTIISGCGCCDSPYGDITTIKELRMIPFAEDMYDLLTELKDKLVGNVPKGMLDGARPTAEEYDQMSFRIAHLLRAINDYVEGSYLDARPLS